MDTSPWASASAHHDLGHGHEGLGDDAVAAEGGKTLLDIEQHSRDNASGDDEEKVRTRRARSRTLTS